MSILLTSVQGYDCSIHMSEETNDASLTIPLVVTSSVALNAIMLLAVGMTFIFCLGDLESVLNTSTGQPVIQVFYNATQSVAGTSVMITIIIIIFLSACVGQVATSSRQIWSFARDKGKVQSAYSSAEPNVGHHTDRTLLAKGFPFSSWLEKVPPAWNIPINAIIVSATFTSILSLINLGTSAIEYL